MRSRFQRTAVRTTAALAALLAIADGTAVHAFTLPGTAVSLRTSEDEATLSRPEIEAMREALLAQHGPSLGGAADHVLLAVDDLANDSLEAARRGLGTAHLLLRRTGEDLGVGAGALTLGLPAIDEGRLEEAQPFLGEAARRLRAGGRSRRPPDYGPQRAFGHLIESCLDTGFLPQWAGRWAWADTAVAELLARSAHGGALSDLGRFAEAEEELETVLSLARSLGVRLQTLVFRQLGTLEMRQRRFAEATQAGVLSAGAALAAVGPHSAQETGAAPSVPPTKRALIVAVATYDRATGWGRLSSDHDASLMQATLASQGFSSITLVQDQEATLEGILAAFEEALIDPARPGDVAVFHFSGHGQQLSDDGDDEPDGYDEALVPYDAPAVLGDGYRGERHLRDDRLHGLIEELRRRVGSGGNVAVFLDTCFSGTPRGEWLRWRGEVQEPALRGGPPLGRPARHQARHGEPGGGFREVVRGATAAGEGLAPYVVFSAARHDEPAYETVDDEDRPVGSLTYALARELAALDEGPTYRRLYDRLRWRMASQVPNRPQVEGEVDSLLFNGRVVEQAPYVEVLEAAPHGRRVTLAAGDLVGFLPGTRVEIHREGSRRPAAESLLAAGEVVDSRRARAVVILEEPAPPAELVRGRTFVTHHAFGPLRLRVQFIGLPPDLSQRLARRLTTRVGAVELVEESPEVLVVGAQAPPGAAGRTAGGWIAAETLGGVPLLLPEPEAAPDLEMRIAGRLLDFARNRYLRRLDLHSPSLRVVLEMVPVAAAGCGDPVDLASCSSFPSQPPESKLAPGGEARWHPGDLYRLRLHHRGWLDAHVTILDLLQDGTIGQLWPDPETGDRTRLPAGEDWESPALYEVTEPPGTEVLLLVASQEWIDFRPFLSREGLRRPRAARADLGPFAPLFDDAAVRARSAPRYAREGIHLDAVTLSVVDVRSDARPGERGSGAGESGE